MAVDGKELNGLRRTVESLKATVENQQKAIARLNLIVTGTSENDLGHKNSQRKMGVIASRSSVPFS